MVNMCDTLLYNHIHETCSGSSHPPTLKCQCGSCFNIYVCVCLCVYFVLFLLCLRILREITICLFFFHFEYCFNYFLNLIFHLSAMFTLIRNHSPVFISRCQKELSGYLWLQAIRTLSKPVFINYCFNSWLISTAEIQGRPLSEEQFNH